MNASAHYLCDQCKTYDASAIDAEAQLWCSRCWNSAAEHVTAAGVCAPLVIDIPYLRLLWFVCPVGDPLLVVSEEVRHRWAKRLGLPLEEKP